MMTMLTPLKLALRFVVLFPPSATFKASIALPSSSISRKAHFARPVFKLPPFAPVGVVSVSFSVFSLSRCLSSPAKPLPYLPAPATPPSAAISAT